MAVRRAVRLPAPPDPGREGISPRPVLALELAVRVTPCLASVEPCHHQIRERGSGLPIYRDMQNFPHNTPIRGIGKPLPRSLI